MKRWRLMEEFENIAKNAPLFAGDTISHAGAKALTDGGLITRDGDGKHILSEEGQRVWQIWRNIPEEPAPFDSKIHNNRPGGKYLCTRCFFSGACSREEEYEGEIIACGGYSQTGPSNTGINEA